MAVIQTSKTVQPTTINKFLGLNLSNTGDTQIQLGESGNMTNFYITDDYKLRKMHGYKDFYKFPSPVKGMASAKIGNNKYLLVVDAGQLYIFNGSTLNDNGIVNPEKSARFTGDGETYQYIVGNSALADVQSIVIGKSKIDNFTEYSDDVLVFSSTTVDEETYPGGTINLVTGRLEFGEVEGGAVETPIAPAEDTNIRVNYVEYLSPSLISVEGGGSLGNYEASFFEFNNCVYILCGDYYKFYKDGDDLKLELVEGYIPKVFINTPPAGGGILYDEINMLTGKKHQTFNPDGTATYQLAQKGIASVDKVLVDNVEKTVGTDYTVNTTNGTVTFVEGHIPASSNVMDQVDIYWTKDDGNRDIIRGMRYGTVFGGDVDTRVFLYGNPNCKNRVYYSAISFENDIAVPSVEYFPATAQVDIGPSNFAVTDLTRQYDRLLATTDKPEAYYLTISTEQLPVTLVDNSSTTRYVPAVSTFPLNETHGNVAMGQGQLLMNYPVTFEDNAIIMWKATNVRDEKNADIISQNIKLDLEKISMANIKTLDLQEQNQLWIIYENEAWIYNYYNKTYSRLKFPLNVNMTSICSLDGKVYMSTSDGWILKFDESFATYGIHDKENPDKNKIDAYWEMNFSDFGVPYLRKTMSKLWILMQPQNWSSADVSYISNIAESTITKHIEYKKQWFDNVDFNDWHFKSSINPQPFKLKLKAKKFTNLKVVIKNEEESACTILSLVLQVENFGYSK